MKPTGTAGSSSAAPAPSSYQLDADDSKLTAHVGQKVEIKVTIAERSSSASKGGSSSDAPKAEGGQREDDCGDVLGVGVEEE